MALGLGLTLVVAHQLHPRPVGQLVVVTAELVEIEFARAIHVGRSELLREVSRRFRAPLQCLDKLARFDQSPTRAIPIDEVVSGSV